MIQYFELRVAVSSLMAVSRALATRLLKASLGASERAQCSFAIDGLGLRSDCIQFHSSLLTNMEH